MPFSSATRFGSGFRLSIMVDRSMYHCERRWCWFNLESEQDFFRDLINNLSSSEWRYGGMMMVWH